MFFFFFYLPNSLTTPSPIPFEPPVTIVTFPSYLSLDVAIASVRKAASLVPETRDLAVVYTLTPTKARLINPQFTDVISFRFIFSLFRRDLGPRDISKGFMGYLALKEGRTPG